MTAQEHEIYLGDGAYASYDGYQVWIWASDGVECTQPVALEPEVFEKLTAFYNRCRGRVNGRTS